MDARGIGEQEDGRKGNRILTGKRETEKWEAKSQFLLGERPVVEIDKSA